jgi:hypothetical protein
MTAKRSCETVEKPGFRLSSFARAKEFWPDMSSPARLAAKIVNFNPFGIRFPEKSLCEAGSPRYPFLPKNNVFGKLP